MNTPSLMVQALSMLGALFCLIAYIGHQAHWLNARKVTYNLLNVLGSGVLAYIAFRPFQAGFWVMETLWGVTSLYGLYKAFTSQK